MIYDLALLLSGRYQVNWCSHHHPRRSSSGVPIEHAKFGLMHSLRGTVSLLLVTLMAVMLAPAPLANALSNSAAVKGAKKALIVVSDFPAGWTTSPSGNTSSSHLGVVQVAACLGVSAKEVTYNPPQANSPNFNQNSAGLSAGDDVEIFPNATVVNQQFDLYSAIRAPTCFAQAFNTPSVKAAFAKQLGTGVTIGKVTSARLARPRVHDRATALSVTIPIKHGGTTITISLVGVIIVSGLKGAELIFTSAKGTAFPASLAAHLESVTAQRLG